MDIAEGLKAPDFTLTGSDRKQHKLSEYIGKKIILYLYPKDNTPACSKEAISFTNNAENFKNLNSIILGISRDTLDSHDKFIKKLNIPYILLSDDDEKVCNLYGVLKEKTMFGKKRMGIERSTFIIDESGNIKKIYRKVKVDGHIEDILESIK